MNCYDKKDSLEIEYDSGNSITITKIEDHTQLGAFGELGYCFHCYKTKDMVKALEILLEKLKEWE